VARFVFQDAVERFIVALEDALLLDIEAGRVNARKASQRGSSGGGLNVESRAIYRAIAVMSVAAWEDFNEQLVLAGFNYLKKSSSGVPANLDKWFPVKDLQSPGPFHVRKLYWAYFNLDPMPSWWFSFAARARDIGVDADWWAPFNDSREIEKRTRRGEDAAKWLDSLVKLRHATAHQDRRHFQQEPELGVATRNRGSWGATRYTAQNSIAVVTQLALCTVGALSRHLSCTGELRYSRALRSWQLSGSSLNELPQWPSS